MKYRFFPLIALFSVVSATAQDEWPSQCKKILNLEAREARMGPDIDKVDYSCINKSGTRAATQVEGRPLQFFMTLNHLRGGPSLEFFRHGDQYHISLSQPSLDGRIQRKELVLDSQCAIQSVSWEWRDEKEPYRQLKKEDCMRKPRDVFEERSEQFRSTRYYCGLYEIPTGPATAPLPPRTKPARPSGESSTLAE